MLMILQIKKWENTDSDTAVAADRDTDADAGIDDTADDRQMSILGKMLKVMLMLMLQNMLMLILTMTMNVL